MIQHPGSGHHRDAAAHYENAARHHREAAKYHDSGNPEKAAYHAYVAYAHHMLATHEAEEAVKHYATRARPGILIAGARPVARYSLIDRRTTTSPSTVQD